MGQVSEASALRAVTPQQLQLIDESNQVYLNIRNQRMYMKKIIVLADIGDFQYQLDIYKFRRLNQMFLVSVDYSSNMKELEICSSFNSLTYYIEKQEYTLFQKATADIQDGLRILLHSLQGFKILYEKFGYFTPNSKLIFFNRYHQPRVWLNQRLETTKNIQNSNGPKNIILQNTFLREIVHLFDGVRNPECPMQRYSDFLPMNFLSFRFVQELFHKKQTEIVAQRQISFKAFRQIQNIRKQSNKQLSIKDMVFSPKSQPFSCQNSPINSPRNSKMIELNRRQYEPAMNFSYKTPSKLQCLQYPPQHHEQIKLATKMSLKNTFINGRTSCQQQNFMKESPSTMPASTMPASVKNSGLFEKCIIIEKLDSSPLNSGNINISTINCQNENKSLKQHASQRYSQAEKPFVSFQVSPINKRLKVSLQQKASYMTNQMEKHELRLSENHESSNPSSNNFLQMRMNNQSGPNFNDVGTRPTFQNHKRHQTDFNFLSKMSSNQSRVNQTSMVDGNYLSKFNLNTIKSIHLLDEDRQMDREIIVDLKQIINKYRRLG